MERYYESETEMKKREIWQQRDGISKMKESMYERVGVGKSILRAGDHEDHPKSGVEGNETKWTEVLNERSRVSYMSKSS